MADVRTGYPYEMGAEDPFAMPPPVIPECPLCSGEVRRDDPAVQALDWGVREAENRGGLSPEWKLATAIHSYERSPATKPKALEDFVGAIRSAQGDGTRADAGIIENPLATLITEEAIGLPLAWSADLPMTSLDMRALWEDFAKWWHIMREKLVDVDEPSYTQRVQREGGGTRSDPWPEHPRCMVDQFFYPVWWAPRPESGERGWKYGFQFEAELVYREKPPKYKCTCCVFRQFWQLTKKGWLAGEDQPKTPNEAWTRDKDSDGGEYGGGRADPGKEDDPAKEKGQYLDGESGCELQFGDVPNSPIDQPGSYAATWDYIGIVFDRCQRWAIRAVRRFVVHRAVTATGSRPWEIRDTEGSPAFFDHVGPVSQSEAVDGAKGEAKAPGRPRPPDEVTERYEEKR